MQKIFKEARDRRNLALATQADGRPPILYVNCRRKAIYSPKAFARVIMDLLLENKLLEEWWKTVPSLWVGGEVKVPGYQADLKKLFEPAADKTPIASIIDSLTIFFEATRPLPYKPVIIIDEACSMLDWSEDPGFVQLKALLDFLVWATKKEHLGHIVLATLESFLVDWLEESKLWRCILVAADIMLLKLNYFSYLFHFLFSPPPHAFDIFFFLKLLCRGSRHRKLRRARNWRLGHHGGSQGICRAPQELGRCTTDVL
jgi:hypothetical protein